MTQGAGGFSISPCLSFSPVVRSDAPAFRIIDTKLPIYVYSAKEIQDCLDMRIQQLSHLYFERRASPHDTDQDGNSILHVCADLFGATLLLIKARKLAKKFSNITYPLWMPIPTKSISSSCEGFET